MAHCLFETNPVMTNDSPPQGEDGEGDGAGVPEYQNGNSSTVQIRYPLVVPGDGEKEWLRGTKLSEGP